MNDLLKGCLECTVGEGGAGHRDRPEMQVALLNVQEVYGGFGIMLTRRNFSAFSSSVSPRRTLVRWRASARFAVLALPPLLGA